MWHIVLLPLVAVLLTVIHVLLVRVKGVVPPFEDAVKGVSPVETATVA
jgi:ubiquinol-cytochrome c reductase cytochrome b subunit